MRNHTRPTRKQHEKRRKRYAYDIDQYEVKRIADGWNQSYYRPLADIIHDVKQWVAESDHDYSPSDSEGTYGI